MTAEAADRYLNPNAGLLQDFTNGVNRDYVLQQTLRQQTFKNFAKENLTLEVAQRAESIYRKSPWIPPDLVMALAKSGASPEAVDTVAELQAYRAVMEKKPERSWFERNVYDKVKTTARWAQATMQFVPEMVQFAGSQIYEDIIGKDNDNIDGWFASTSLGTMIGNSTKSGNGWFIGGEAKTIQEERARRARGTIEGTNSAFTIGRGLASAVAKPGSVQYNILSGAIDAAVTLKTDPLNLVFGPKAVTKAFAEGASTVPKISQETATVAAKIAAGVATSAEEAAWNSSKINRWFDQSSHAKRLISFLSENSSPSEIMRAFKDKVPPEVAQALAGMTDENQIRAALAALSSPFGLTGDIADDTIKLFNLNPEHMVRSLSKLPGANRSFTSVWREFIPGYETWHRWVGTLAPKQLLNVGGSSVQRAEAINNIRRYIDTIGDQIDPDVWKSMLNEGVLQGAGVDAATIANITKAVSGAATNPGGVKQAFMDYAVHAYSQATGTQGAIKATESLFNSIVTGVLKTNGVKDGVISALLKRVEGATQEFRRYYAERALSGDDPGVLKMLLDSGIIDPNDINKLLTPGMTMDDLRILGPLELTDFLNSVMVLPDPRKLRSLSQNPWWRRTIQAIYVDGDGALRGPVRLLDKVQNEYWKPLQLMSGGYIMRNIIDGQMRMALTGKAAGIFNSPFSYIGWAISNSRGRYGITGSRFDWKKLADMAEEEWTAAQRYYMDTQASAAGRHLWAPDEALEGVVRTGDVGIAERQMERGLHTQAIADQLGRARQSVILRMIVEGKSTDEIVMILNNSEDGRKAIAELINNNKTGMWVSEPNGKRAFQEFAAGWDTNPQLRDEYVKALIDGNFRQRVAYLDNPGNENLKFAFLNNRAPRGPIEQLGVTSTSNGRINNTFDIVDGPGSFGRPDDVGVGTLFHEPNSDTLYQVVGKNVINGDEVLDVQRVSQTPMWIDDPNIPATDELRNLIDETGDAGNLPKSEVYFKRKAVDPGERDWWRSFTEKWFNDIVGKKFMRRFEKDPFWRQFYYKHVAENIDLLSPEEAAKLVSKIEKEAARLGITPAQYVGGGSISRLNFKVGSKEFSLGDQRWQEIKAAVFGRKATRLEGETVGVANLVDENVVNITNEVDNLTAQADDLQRQIDDINSQLQTMAGTTFGTNVQQSLVPNNPAAQALIQDQVDLISQRDAILQQVAARKDDLAAAKSVSPVGTGTIEQLDEYAGYMATMDVKDQFFDAAEKSNFGDAMRIVSPFGSAWASIMGDYTRMMIQNPYRALRAQRAYNAAQEADPFNTGQGFIFKDLITNQMTFAFPLSDQISWLLTGMNAPLTAPVKQLSVGYSLVPSLGPAVQIGLSSLYKYAGSPDVVDLAVEIFMPYGTDKGVAQSFMPGWLVKASEALRGDTGKTGTMFANTWMETVRALSTTGNYDLSQPEEQQRLLEDARDKARKLMAMRAVSQFIGPTSGSLSFRVKSAQGDVYAAYLSKEFYRMQAENYDTAVEEFITTFGDDVFLYLSSKSKATIGGLEPTDQFVKWQKNNEGFVLRNPLVYPYFAPGGDDFSFAAWNKMMSKRQFTRLNPMEMIEQAQLKLGSAKYRAAKQKMGPYPTEEQKDWLRNYRKELNKQYPGFPEVAEFPVGGLDKFINKLKIAVDDKSVSGTAIAGAIREYLGLRDRALEALKRAGLAGTSTSLKQSKTAIPTRAWLFAQAQQIIMRVPEFGRIFDRELSAELED